MANEQPRWANAQNTSEHGQTVGARLGRISLPAGNSAGLDAEAARKLCGCEVVALSCGGDAIAKRGRLSCITHGKHCTIRVAK